MIRLRIGKSYMTGYFIFTPSLPHCLLYLLKGHSRPHFYTLNYLLLNVGSSFRACKEIVPQCQAVNRNSLFAERIARHSLFRLNSGAPVCAPKPIDFSYVSEEL